MAAIEDLPSLRTPALVLDETKMQRNIDRLRALSSALDVPLRPHMKTAKSVNVARRLTGGTVGPITVSTLA